MSWNFDKIINSWIDVNAWISIDCIKNECLVSKLNRKFALTVSRYYYLFRSYKTEKCCQILSRRNFNFQKCKVFQNHGRVSTCLPEIVFLLTDEDSSTSILTCQIVGSNAKVYIDFHKPLIITLLQTFSSFCSDFFTFYGWSILHKVCIRKVRQMFHCTASKLCNLENIFSLERLFGFTNSPSYIAHGLVPDQMSSLEQLENLINFSSDKFVRWSSQWLPSLKD